MGVHFTEALKALQLWQFLSGEQFQTLPPPTALWGGSLLFPRTTASILDPKQMRHSLVNFQPRWINSETDPKQVRKAAHVSEPELVGNFMHYARGAATT